MNFNFDITRTGAVSGIIATCVLAFSGCLPPSDGIPKQALYYQQSNDTPALDRAWIKRWLPATGKSELVLIQQGNDSGDGIYGLGMVQPHGSNILLWQSRDGEDEYTSHRNAYVLVPDSNDRQPRLLYESTRHSYDPYENRGGHWLEYASDGKHIAMHIDYDAVITAGDGTGRRTVGYAEFDRGHIANFSWSPDGSKLAFTGTRGRLEVIDTATFESTAFSSNDELNYFYEAPHWIADNQRIISSNSSYPLLFDLRDPTSTVLAFSAENGEPGGFVIWSPEGDRVVEADNYYNSPSFDYVLKFVDGRDNLTLLTVPNIEGESFYRLMPKWSSDGEKLAYADDTDDDGDTDIVIASKDGAVLNTITDFGVVLDMSIAWSPDGSNLLVATNANPAHGGIIEGKLIDVASSTVTPLFEVAAGFLRDGHARIEWSPDSRYVIFGDGYSLDWDDANVSGLLFDTEQLDAPATALTFFGFEWSFDSAYLAITTKQADGSDNCSLAIIAVADTTYTPKAVAKNTTCHIGWSNPDPI